MNSCSVSVKLLTYMNKIFLLAGLAFGVVYLYLFAKLIRGISPEDRGKHNKAGLSRLSFIFILIGWPILIFTKNSNVQLGLFILYMIHSMWASFQHRRKMLALGVSVAIVNKFDLIGILSSLGVLCLFLSYWI